MSNDEFLVKAAEEPRISWIVMESRFCPFPYLSKNSVVIPAEEGQDYRGFATTRFARRGRAVGSTFSTCSVTGRGRGAATGRRSNRTATPAATRSDNSPPTPRLSMRRGLEGVTE